MIIVQVLVCKILLKLKSISFTSPRNLVRLSLYSSHSSRASDNCSCFSSLKMKQPNTGLVLITLQTGILTYLHELLSSRKGMSGFAHIAWEEGMMYWTFM